MSEIPGPSPEQMNVEASLPPKTEVSGFDAPAEALGLQNMNFTVRRNVYDGNGNKQDGFTEETGCVCPGSGAFFRIRATIIGLPSSSWISCVLCKTLSVD
jgi:hypothetical protein